MIMGLCSLKSEGSKDTRVRPDLAFAQQILNPSTTIRSKTKAFKYTSIALRTTRSGTGNSSAISGLRSVTSGTPSRVQLGDPP